MIKKGLLAALAILMSLVFLAGCPNPLESGNGTDNTDNGDPPPEDPPPGDPVSVIQWSPDLNTFGIIPCNTKIEVTFDGSIDFDTVDASTFAVKDAANNPVDGDFSYLDPVLTFTPASLLSLNTQYTVTVAGILDGSGHEVTAANHQFTTSKRVLRLFTRGLGGFYHCPVAQRDGYFYLGTSRMEAWNPAADNAIFKIDGNLNLVWEFPLGYSEAAGGATIDSSGNVYIAVRENPPGATNTTRGGNVYLYKLNPAGVKQWQVLILEGGIQSHDMVNPALASDELTIYVPGTRLYAIDTGAGSVTWSYPEYAASSRHSVIIDSSNHLYYANIKLDLSLTPAEEGFFVWNGSALLNAPALSFDETTLYGSGPGGTTMYLVETDTGAVRASFSIIQPPADQAYIWDSPAVDAAGNVYFGTKTNSNENAVFYALDGNGNKLWESGRENGGIGSDMYSSPVIGDDGIIYCGSENAGLNAYNKTTGVYQWSEPIGAGDTIFGSPIIAGGYLYIATIGDQDNERGGSLLQIDIDASGYETGAGWPCFQGGNAKTGRRLDM